MDFPLFRQIHSRRKFLQETAGGVGAIALWELLANDGRAAQTSREMSGAEIPSRAMPSVNPLQPKAPHFAPKAKNVIFLYMAGAPSQLDLFDPKPEMKKWEGQPLPHSMTQHLDLAFIKPTAKIWASPYRFQPRGECGMEISDLLPYTAGCADDICLIRSAQTDQINHHPGQLMMNCGSGLVGRPSMGAWVSYGLGSEAQNLPGFVVLSTGGGTSAGNANWGSGFLPSSYQGVPFRGSGDPVLYLSNPPGYTREDQRERLDVLRDLNEQRYFHSGDVEIASRIASYELAFRMQAAGPELLDFSGESAATRAMYGIDQEPTRPFATNCLLARRMVERGVRFVQLFHKGCDNHANLKRDLKKQCDITDEPTAALLKDLKQRGLLDETLVVWGSEFGRTPMVENRQPNQADKPGPGSPPARLQHLDGRRRNQGRAGGRQERRSRFQYSGRPGSCPRPPRDDSAQPGAGSQTPNLSPPRPRLPPNRRGRNRCRKTAGVTGSCTRTAPALEPDEPAISCNSLLKACCRGRLHD